MITSRLVVQPSSWWRDHLASLLASYGEQDPSGAAQRALRHWLAEVGWPRNLIQVAATADDSEEQP